MKIPRVPTGALRRSLHLPGSCIKYEDNMRYRFCGISVALCGKKAVFQLWKLRKNLSVWSVCFLPHCFKFSLCWGHLRISRRKFLFAGSWAWGGGFTMPRCTGRRWSRTEVMRHSIKLSIFFCPSTRKIVFLMFQWREGQVKIFLKYFL